MCLLRPRGGGMLSLAGGRSLIHKIERSSRSSGATHRQMINLIFFAISASGEQQIIDNCRRNCKWFICLIHLRISPRPVQAGFFPYFSANWRVKSTRSREVCLLLLTLGRRTIFSVNAPPIQRILTVTSRSLLVN